MHTKVPMLSLLSSLEGHKPNSQVPAEREINRAVLTNVAPDREDLFRSSSSIEEIRQSLKLRIGLSQTSVHLSHSCHTMVIDYIFQTQTLVASCPKQTRGKGRRFYYAFIDVRSPWFGSFQWRTRRGKRDQAWLISRGEATRSVCLSAECSSVQLCCCRHSTGRNRDPKSEHSG